MLQDRVKTAVPVAPGAVNVGSAITLGAAPSGFRSWLAAFGAGASAYFVMADGAGRAIGGVWTINATTPETATITEILQNDRLGGTAGETFTNPCTAWNERPAREVPLLRSSPLGGLRNLIINGNPLTNQRGYVSGSAVGAANTYTLDRWRVVTSGQAVSWSDSAGLRTVTAPAGGMEQVIEGAALRAGIYTLNWTGTATATINGAAVVKGGQVTLPGGTNATLRLTGGTWSEVQLEPGPIATPFEQRPIGLERALCQRYFCRLDLSLQGAIGFAIAPVFFPVAMRTTPAVSNVSPGTATSATHSATIARDELAGYWQIQITGASGNIIGRIDAFSAEF